MSNYDNTNKGALFVNERKQTDKHPDWNGKLNINGTEYWISGWSKQSQRGELISLALGQQVEQQAQRQAPARQPQRSAPPPRRQAPPQRQPEGYDQFPEDSDVPW